MAKHHRVLVTGSAGVVGTTVCQELLRRGHFVRGFDLSPSPHATESHTGSIADADAVDRAMDSIDTLIHLAATPRDGDFLTQLLPNNFVGVHSVLQSALRHKPRRVVLTSSITVMGPITGWTRTLRVDDSTDPRSHYAVSKVFTEAMGKMYATKHSLSVITVRLGWVTRTPEEARRMKEIGAEACFLSHRDAGRFYACAVEAEDVKHATLFASSKPPHDVGMDLSPARERIGYEPIDCFPSGLPFALTD